MTPDERARQWIEANVASADPGECVRSLAAAIRADRADTWHAVLAEITANMATVGLGSPFWPGLVQARSVIRRLMETKEAQECGTEKTDAPKS